MDDATVVLAGDGAGPAAAELAAAHHLPLLAEPSSGARHGSTLVPGHPALLREIMADPAHPLRPRRAIVLGRPTLSRPVVGGLLGAEDVEVIVVDPQLDWPDVARRARLVVPAAVGEEQPGADGTGGVDGGSGTDRADDGAPSPDPRALRTARLEVWREASRAAGEREAARTPLTWQERAALAVWDASEAGDTLVLGSSSLIRDLEQHAGPTSARVIANRGLAGIDGTTAMAGGLALAHAEHGAPALEGAPATPGTDAPGERPALGEQPAPGERRCAGRVRLLVGDLTALHDLTGLLVGPLEPRPVLDVIVVDDGGGRIFSGLEHAAAPPDLLRRFFTTPHGADIAGAVSALGAPALRLTPDQLPAALAVPATTLRVLVVQPPPSGDTANS